MEKFVSEIVCYEYTNTNAANLSLQNRISALL